MKKSFLILFLLIASRVCAEPTDSLQRWGFTVGVNPGKALAVDHYQRMWQKGTQNLAFDVMVDHVELPADSSDYAADWGYPVISTGLKIGFNHGVTMRKTPAPEWGMAEMVDYDSKMGNSVALHSSFVRPFFRNSRWQVDYALSGGVGYSKSKYNNYNNVDNELIGSRWLVFFEAGFHGIYRFADSWGIRAGLDFWHLSNGALNRPNKGVNFLGPSVALVYVPYFKALAEGKAAYSSKPHPKNLYLNFSAGVGAKALNEEWLLAQYSTPKGEPGYRTNHYKAYLAYSFQTDLMYRYHRKWASGVGADLFYGTYADRVAEIDEKYNKVDLPHSPWSFGLSLKHQVFYHRLSLAVSLGYYLYRHMGHNANQIEKPYYEKIGVRYEIPKAGGLSVGFAVKAHLTKADLTEFVLAVPVKL